MDESISAWMTVKDGYNLTSLRYETSHESENGVFSEELTKIFILVNILIISTLLCIFGIATNIATIAVFVKQGFHDTINIILSAIAVSDTCACITLLWTAVCYNPLFLESDPPFLIQEVEYLTGGGTHQMALNITAWLTAFVTFERCVSIASPLKVKTIFTTFRIKAFIAATFLLTIICKMPAYSTTHLDWIFVPDRNKTYVGLVFADNSQTINKINFYVFDLASLITSFSIVVLCTLILTIKLWQKSKWRQSTAANTNKDQRSAKDKRVIKMVAMVAVIFITCYTPKIFISIWMAMVPEFRNYAKYGNNFMVAYSVSSVFESFNVSINICVYYIMSTRFRHVFRDTFLKQEKTTNVP